MKDLSSILNFVCVCVLQEGVHHFSASAKKNVPWRKILDLGRHKFHKSRTPADLKDKWRNMTAK